MTRRAIGRRLRRKTACGAALLALGVTLATAPHASVVFDPLLPGQYAAGTGADATFLRIDGSWTGSAVYWKEPPDNETPGQYSNTPDAGFDRIGTYGWGTGL